MEIDKGSWSPSDREPCMEASDTDGQRASFITDGLEINSGRCACGSMLTKVRLLCLESASFIFEELSRF